MFKTRQCSNCTASLSGHQVGFKLIAVVYMRYRGFHSIGFVDVDRCVVVSAQEQPRLGLNKRNPRQYSHTATLDTCSKSTVEIKQSGTCVASQNSSSPLC